eukprot:365732-Chlamydomonas_euryale.AAC.4
MTRQPLSKLLCWLTLDTQNSRHTHCHPHTCRRAGRRFGCRGVGEKKRVVDARRSGGGNERAGAEPPPRARSKFPSVFGARVLICLVVIDAGGAHPDQGSVHVPAHHRRACPGAACARPDVAALTYAALHSSGLSMEPHPVDLARKSLQTARVKSGTCKIRQANARFPQNGILIH